MTENFIPNWEAGILKILVRRVRFPVSFGFLGDDLDGLLVCKK